MKPTSKTREESGGAETSWFLSALLRVSITGPAHRRNLERTDAVGLHRLIDEEDESSQEDKQQQPHPREGAAACCLGLTSRGRCKRGPGVGRGVDGGGGTGHAGESMSEAALHVGGGLGGGWREQQALLPQFAGPHGAICSSFDGSPTGGAK